MYGVGLWLDRWRSRLVNLQYTDILKPPKLYLAILLLFAITWRVYYQGCKPISIDGATNNVVLS